MLEIRNQQLAEMQKKAGEKPPPTPAAKTAEKPAAEAPKPAPGPAPAPAPGPIAQAPEKPAAQAPKPAAPIAKPAPRPVAAPPPEPSLFDEVLDNPVALAGLGAVVLLLLVYALVAWRKKKTVHAKFQDSVIGAAAAGASISEPTFGAATPSASQPGSQLPPGLAAEEVDPIAEADVYMAYGRDSQAEEILKEALQKDPNRTPVHGKLLELYAKRRDVKAFEQTALKLKNATHGAGPEWDKAVALGHSIDPQNGLYAGAAAAAAAVAAAPAAPAPMLDFDIGGAQQASASSPDLTLDSGPKGSDTALDFDVSGTSQEKDRSAEQTVVASASRDTSAGGLDFNLDLGTAAEEAPAPAPAPAAADPGLTFDLNLDLGGETNAEADKAAPPPDLSTISLDLGSAEASGAAASGTDPKWQEIATKLDLAKAYEEMGDKDGARELLNEVMKDGDAAQKGQAQQLLARLG
jgi:pilus assembly protein FimV